MLFGHLVKAGWVVHAALLPKATEHCLCDKMRANAGTILAAISIDDGTGQDDPTEVNQPALLAQLSLFVVRQIGLVGRFRRG